MTAEEARQTREVGEQVEQSSTLEELCDNLNELQEAVNLDTVDNNFSIEVFVDMDKLPTFGGRTPVDTRGVYSWNETHILTEGNQWQLEEREDTHMKEKQRLLERCDVVRSRAVKTGKSQEIIELDILMGFVKQGTAGDMPKFRDRLKVLAKAVLENRTIEEEEMRDIERILSMFLNNGGDPNVQDSLGWTPIMNAKVARCPKVVQNLISAGADVNAESVSGWTPLMSAASVDCRETVQLLLDNGANVNLINDAGDTALRVAEYDESYSVIDILKEAEKRTEL